MATIATALVAIIAIVQFSKAQTTISCNQLKAAAISASQPVPKCLGEK